MSYIGVQSQNHVSPAFHREVVTPDGSASFFDLVQDVPGFNADNVLVVVNNVVQHPFDSYTIKADANGNPRRLDFAGTVPASTDVIYVTHRGVGSLNMTPAAGSVDSVALADNLRSGVVNSFTGSQATNSSTQLTLTEEPLNAQSIMVYVNGVYQKPTTNYTVSGTTLTFTGALASSDEIDVHHLSIRTGVVHVADRSVTSDKLDDNITIRGNLTVSGTTTTVDSTTLSVADPLISLATGNNSSDAVDIGLYGLYDTSGSTDLYGGLFRDANDSGKWKLFKDLQAAPTTTVNTSGTGYAVGTLVANIESSSATITGGTITGITDLVVADGGTGAGTFTSKGILYGNGTGALQVTAAGTEGQILQAGSGGTPEFGGIDGGTY